MVKNSDNKQITKSLIKMTRADIDVAISIRFSRWASALGPKAARRSCDFALLRSGPLMVFMRRIEADSNGLVSFHNTSCYSVAVMKVLAIARRCDRPHSISFMHTPVSDPAPAGLLLLPL